MEKKMEEVVNTVREKGTDENITQKAEIDQRLAD